MGILRKKRYTLQDRQREVQEELNRPIDFNYNGTSFGKITAKGLNAISKGEDYAPSLDWEKASIKNYNNYIDNQPVTIPMGQKTVFPRISLFDEKPSPAVSELNKFQPIKTPAEPVKEPVSITLPAGVVRSIDNITNKHMTVSNGDANEVQRNYQKNMPLAEKDFNDYIASLPKEQRDAATKYVGLSKLDLYKGKLEPNTDTGFMRGLEGLATAFTQGAGDTFGSVYKTGANLLSGGQYGTELATREQYYKDNPDKLGERLLKDYISPNSVTGINDMKPSYSSDNNYDNQYVGTLKATDLADKTNTRYENMPKLYKDIKDMGVKSAGQMLGASLLAGGGEGAVLGKLSKVPFIAKVISKVPLLSKVAQATAPVMSDVAKIEGANKVVQGLSSLTGKGAAAFATKNAIKAVDITPTTTVMGATQAQQRYDELIKQGVAPADAMKNALAQGYVSAVTEKMGFEGLGSIQKIGKEISSKGIKNVMQGLGKYGIASVSEGSEEILNVLFNGVADNMTNIGYVDSNGKRVQRPLFGDNGVVDPKSMGTNFYGGFIGGLVMGSLGTGINLIDGTSSAKTLKEQAQATNDMNDRMQKLATTAGVKTNLPGNLNVNNTTEEQIKTNAARINAVTMELLDNPAVQTGILIEQNIKANENIKLNMLKAIENIDSDIAIATANKSTKSVDVLNQHKEVINGYIADMNTTNNILSNIKEGKETNPDVIAKYTAPPENPTHTDIGGEPVHIEKINDNEFKVDGVVKTADQVLKRYTPIGNQATTQDETIEVDDNIKPVTNAKSSPSAVNLDTKLMGHGISEKDRSDILAIHSNFENNAKGIDTNAVVNITDKLNTEVANELQSKFKKIKVTPSAVTYAANLEMLTNDKPVTNDFINTHALTWVKLWHDSNSVLYNNVVKELNKTGVDSSPENIANILTDNSINNTLNNPLVNKMIGEFKPWMSSLVGALDTIKSSIYKTNPNEQLSAIPKGDWSTVVSVNNVVEDKPAEEVAPSPESSVQTVKTKTDKSTPKETIDENKGQNGPSAEDDKVTLNGPSLEERDNIDLGDRKVKAYQYDNPEVKPYFQFMAKYLLDNEFVNGNETLFAGRQVLKIPEAMQHMRDMTGLNPADVKKGLESIIKDHGSENIVAAKKIELAIDDMLSYGFINSEGEEESPDADYIKLKEELENKKLEPKTKTEELPMTEDNIAKPYIRNIEDSKSISIYHGSANSNLQSLKSGTWYSPVKEFAQKFADGKAVKGNSKVYESKLDIPNTKFADISKWGMEDYITPNEFADEVGISRDELKSALAQDIVGETQEMNKDIALRYLVDIQSVSDLLSSKGYDGLKAKEGLNSSTDYVDTYKIFKETPVEYSINDAKSVATDNTSKYLNPLIKNLATDRGIKVVMMDSTSVSDNAKYSIDSPAFYSKLQQVVSDKVRDNMPAANFVEFLRGHGVKADEIKWSGIEQYLAENKKVNKAGLLYFLKSNELKIEEVVHKDNDVSDRIKKEQDEFEKTYNEKLDAFMSLYGKEMGREISYIEIEDWGDEAYSIFDNEFSQELDNLFMETDTIASNWASLNDTYEIRNSGEYESEAKYSKYKIDGGSNYREMLFTLPENSGKYQSAHWMDQNVVAHTRLQDMTDSEGNRTLFVEEIQSDWHQAGREKGYITKEASDNDSLINSKIEELKNELDNKSIRSDAELISLEKSKEDKETQMRILERTMNPELPSEELNKIKVEYDKIKEEKYAIVNASSVRYKEVSEVVKKEKAEINAKIEELNSQKTPLRNAVPEAPFTKTWHEFVLKRLLRYAAENGYDKIAWTTGKQQADRYDLAKYIKYIGWTKFKDNYYNLNAKAINGDLMFNETGIGLGRIAELVGKDVAKQIEVSNKKYDTIEGSGLSVGGEGMKGFYDVGGKSSQNIPAFLNKYTKQWGGKVETSTINGNEQPSVTINPAMIASVMNVGQPLFNVNNTKVNAYYDSETKTIHLNPNANQPLVTLLGHELFHSLDKAEQGKLISFFRSNMNANSEEFKAYKESITKMYQAEYTKNNRTFTENDFWNEFAAENAATLFTNKTYIEKLSRANRTLLQKIYDFIKDMINTLRTPKYRNTKATETAGITVQTLERAEKMYAKALGIKNETVDDIGYGDVIENIQPVYAMDKGWLTETLNTVNFSKKRMEYLFSAYSAKFHDDYAQAYVSYMAPTDFLSLTTTDLSNIEKESKPLDINELKDERQPIFLKFNEKTGQITGHEGRHRMVALRDAGIERVAVVLMPDSDEYDKYNAEIIPKITLKGQTFRGIGTATGTTVLNDVYPLSVKYKDEIEKRFTKNDAINYSLDEPTLEEKKAEAIAFKEGNKVTSKDNKLTKALGATKEGAVYLKNIATRTFKDIPESGALGTYYAEFRKNMVQWIGLPQKASADAQVMMDSMIKDFTQDEYDTFSDIVYYEDLKEEAGIQADKGQEVMLTGNVDLETVNSLLEDLYAKKNEAIDKALQTRKELWEKAREEYIEYHKYIGFNVENKMMRKNYFRHEVIAYMEQNKKDGNNKVQINSFRSSLKERHANDMAINSDFAKVEYQALYQMRYDTYKAKTLYAIKGYSIKPSLQKQATQMNKDAVDAIIRQETNGEYETKNGKLVPKNSDTYKEMQHDNQMIMLGITKLIDMAKNGTLTDFNGVFSDVVDELADGKANGNNFYKFVGALAGEENNIPAMTILKYTSHKKSFVKKLLGKSYKTWKDIVPEDHKVVQPRKGNHMYRKDVVTEGEFEKAVTDIATSIASGINDPNVLEVFEQYKETISLIGAAYEEWVLPEAIVKTMDEISNPKEPNPLSTISRFGLNVWKGWSTAVNPLRTVKFGIRNMVGDLDAVIGGNPLILKETPRAIQEIFRVMRGGFKSTEFAEWEDRGGMINTSFIQELDEPTQKKLYNYMQTNKNNNLLKTLSGPFRNYFKTVESAHGFREAILRYSAYLYAKESIKKNNGVVKDYLASNKWIIDGLHSNTDKAYQLSKDLLGAYDELSVLGKTLRRHFIPFFSFTETNFKRNVRLFKNIITSNDKIPMKVAKLALKSFQVALLTTLINAWNKYMRPDDDEKLPLAQRARPHITLGSIGDNVYSFTRLGSVTELLEWFGFDDFKFTKDDLYSPVNKVWGMVTPVLKTPTELLRGKTDYPDLTKPQNIKDGWEYFFNSWGVAEVYNIFAGKPNKGWGQVAENALYYKSSVEANALSEIQSKKREFQNKMDVDIKPSEKSNALYYMKMAVKNGQKDIAIKYVNEYFNSGGTGKGVSSSFASLDPQYGFLGKETKAKEAEFLKTLDENELKKWEIAKQYYKDNLQLPPNMVKLLSKDDIDDSEAKNVLLNYINASIK